MPKALIVIVNYRTAKLVKDALVSIEQEDPVANNYQVVVVDNCSNDSSAVTLQQLVICKGWQDWVSILPLNENRGFAAGNNAAILPVLNSIKCPDYFLLLNPDTVLRPGAVTSLVNFAEQHPAGGIFGSRLEDPDGSPQRSAFRFPGACSEFERSARTGLISKLLSRFIVAPPVVDTPFKTDWVAGASMLVRSEVFQTVGLMDEKYFLYFEELDFCKRAHQQNWDCWYVPESRVVHLVGQSSGIGAKKQELRRVPPYWFESRRRYFERNEGRIAAFVCDIAWAMGHGVWEIRRRLQRKPNDTPPFLFADLISCSLNSWKGASL